MRLRVRVVRWNTWERQENSSAGKTKAGAEIKDTYSRSAVASKPIDVNNGGCMCISEVR
ncbi:hypothetical protein IQ06DRAFT_289185 [Phaeosphaeriaceae sp. SRC1lsM3a]|nr:hypothetical protein IQ06DRAFT_289185 [Stagonospora sp. SRC1lsM3a]